MSDAPHHPGPDAIPGSEAPARAGLGQARRTISWRVVLFSVGCLVLVVALRLWLSWVGPLPGDRWTLSRNDYGGQSRTLLDLGNFFQVLGTPVIAAIVIAWAVVFVFRAEGRRGVAFVLLSALGMVFNALIKGFLSPTPLIATLSPSAQNYPSGHVVYAVVVFGSLAWIAWVRERRDIATALLFLVVLMGPFRITIGAHFLSDVIAAYLVGLAWLVPAAMVTGYGPGRAGASATAAPSQ